MRFALLLTALLGACAYDGSGVPDEWLTDQDPAATSDEPSQGPAELGDAPAAAPDPPAPPPPPPPPPPGTTGFFDACTGDTDCAKGICFDFGGQTGWRCTELCSGNGGGGDDGGGGGGPKGECPKDAECRDSQGVCRPKD